MKETVRRLTQDFNNLKELLIDLRGNKHLSYNQMGKYFSSLGYPSSDSMMKRLCKKYNIDIYRDRSGERNSFYNKEHTDVTRNKISVAHKSGGYSKGKRNYFYGKSGDRSPAWKGGTSTKRALFYASKPWADKRLEIFILDKFTCQVCGYQPGNNRKSLNAHHIVPLHIDWSLCLENNNIITLCVDCHKKTFNREKEFIPIFQDIVRATGRLVEVNRNDLPQQEIVV